ncbi:unnamed protein product [Orchesella dallaii]|uniref:Uncharacterized protein n=1 Tax=Orchesella dallaii TaxID=48710 RepID=A0ABP1PKI5_9HEXA
MISDISKRATKLRLQVANHTKCSVMYWDTKQDRCVLTSGVDYWNWVLAYYPGYLIIPMLVLILYLKMNSDEFPEEENFTIKSNQNAAANRKMTKIFPMIAMIFMGLLVFIVIFCQALVSELKARKVEICTFFNSFFELDRKLKEAFNRGNGSKIIDQLIKSNRFNDACYLLTSGLSFIPPFVLFIFFFHPSEPLHMILEEILEIDVKPSFSIFCIDAIYCVEAYAASNTMFAFIITAVFALTSSVSWLNAVMPLNSLNAKATYFETESFGVLDFKTIIWIYRCHQLLCLYANDILANIRSAPTSSTLYLLLGNFAYDHISRVLISKQVARLLC